jgi:ubiquinone/menaquinone biosynthesis C-methylase UbiE
VSVNLPYFDLVLRQLESKNREFELAFGRHVHWGYWPEPSRADQTAEDYAKAAEALTWKVCEAARVGEGQRILDVGCGFGGTVASLNEKFTGLDLVGVNIDERQLERARRMVPARPGNRVEFRYGDACALPFPDQSFDRVLAVECIFHFPDRRQFFDEAARVLKPGSYLALSDILPAAWFAPLARLGARSRELSELFGQCKECTLSGYRRLARESGLEVVREENITGHTLPTYAFLLALPQRMGGKVPPGGMLATRCLEFTSRIGALRYQVLAFKKPA